MNGASAPAQSLQRQVRAPIASHYFLVQRINTLTAVRKARLNYALETREAEGQVARPVVLLEGATLVRNPSRNALGQPILYVRVGMGSGDCIFVSDDNIRCLGGKPSLTYKQNGLCSGASARGFWASARHRRRSCPLGQASCRALFPTEAARSDPEVASPATMLHYSQIQ